MNQGLMGSAQMPDLISSMPLTTATSIGISPDFNSFDPKNPLKSLPNDLVPMPFKSSINMGGSVGGGGGGMFSTSSGTLFGGPRTISSTSSSLQLSSSTSSGFSYLQDSKNGGGCQIPGSAHMSATALLQKAAQMGATASNSINSPMMQKSFTGNMAGPSYGGMHNTTYDQFPTQHDHHQASVVVGVNGGGGGLISNPQAMQKGQQEMSQLFDGGGGSSGMSDMGMFATMFIGNDQNPSGLMRNHNMSMEINHEDGVMMQGRAVMMERNNNTNNNSNNNNPASRFGAEGEDVMTRDFMGIGGSARPANLHEQQQRLEMEAMSQQRMPMMNHFQQHLSLGESAMDKPIWDV